MLAVVCLVSSRQIANAQATNAQTANASNAGISGKWHFVMDTPGGDREMDAEFTVDADGKVTGKYGITDVAGTFRDGKLDLNFQMTSEESGQTAALKLVGKLDETAALVGTWEFSEYNGAFKATRPKP
jgi:flagellar basal body rod protein FlgG